MAETLGQALRRLRKQTGLTQPELARKTYMTQSTISRLESGRCPMTYDHARRLDDVLSAAGELSKLCGQLGISDIGTLDELASVLSIHRRLEDETSPEAVLPTVRECLAMSERFVSEASLPRRSAAASLTSELAQYRGWLEFAAGNQARAERCFDRAVALAAEHDAPDRLTHGLSFRAYTSLERGHTKNAESLTHAALRDSRVHPLIRLYDRYQLARVYAQSGERYAAHQALIKADRVAETTDHGNPPDSGYWYTPGLWALHKGRILWWLGEYEQALAEARSGMATMPQDHQDASWSAKWLRALSKNDLTDVMI